MQLLKAPKLRFADEKLLMQHLGVTPGSVTPFGLINDSEHKVQLIIDNSILQGKSINAHPLENSATTNISVDDLKKFLKATEHSPIIIDLIAYNIFEEKNR